MARAPFFRIVSWLLLLFAGGCAQTTAQPILYADGLVQIMVLEEPEGRQLLGRVEVTGRRRMPELLEEFAARAARLGGRIGKIDSIRTAIEPDTRSESRFSTCGRFPRLYSCYRSAERTSAAVTTTLSGRAFR